MNTTGGGWIVIQRNKWGSLVESWGKILSTRGEEGEENGGREGGREDKNSMSQCDNEVIVCL